MRREAAALVVTAALLAPCRRASAATPDLRDVASRVEGAWRAAGGVTSRRDTHFVMEDESITIDIRGQPTTSPDGPDEECRRVALIGARGMTFHVNAGPGETDGTFRVGSTAGVIELSGCGATLPRTLKLKSDSGRGALETVIATTRSSTLVLPAAFAVLLERTGGVLPLAPEPGPLPPLPPPSSRASAAEARYLREGFIVGPQGTWTAGDDGKGGGLLELEEGCHRLELFASEPRHDGTGHHLYLDLDGSLKREGGDAMADDQSSAPDVRLDACVAASTKARLAFEGAPRRSIVLVTDGLRPIPPHIPSFWPAELRARFAAVLVARDVLPLREDAVLVARGAAGNTPVAMALEPDACYLAVAATERGRGHGHGVGLHVSLGDGARSSDDEQGAKDGAALAAFCAQGDTFARIVIDARSSSSGWGVAVFRVLGGAWGGGA